jgi:DNA-binding winged helix-turn-helix (wHTH) protein
MARISNSVDRSFHIGEVLVLPASNEIRKSGNTIRVEPRLIRLIDCLARNAGEPVARAELLNSAWRDGAGSDESLTQAISHLRRLLGDSARNPRMIQTLPKRGYRLVEQQISYDVPQARPAVTPPGRMPGRMALAACMLLAAFPAATTIDRLAPESELTQADWVEEDPDYDFDIDFEDDVDPDPG